jgi:endoglucanase
MLTCLLGSLLLLPIGVPDHLDIHAANKKLGRGVNIGNCLEAPQEGAWGVRLREEYFKLIKEGGFDTIRLPTNWAAHADTKAPYKLDEAFLARVDWAVNQALANKLNIILNIHHYHGLDSNPDAHQERFLAIWEQLAAHFQSRPNEVYFELYNEPHDKLTEAKWNDLIPKVLGVIRKTNPTRPVIVGPGQWNAIRALPKLQLPESDRNLIVTVHCYDPFQFTHQGASWAKGSDQWKGTKWTGTEKEQGTLRQSLERAAKWAKDHDRPLFLGEFGAYSGADMESRVRWTRFLAREAERLGFSWAYWEFAAGFGVYDPRAKAWREPLKAALLENQAP